MKTADEMNTGVTRMTLHGIAARTNYVTFHTGDSS
jgi:hypothetical protein